MVHLAKAYQIFIWIGKIIQPFLLLALRLFWGWQFFQAGLGKLGNIGEVVEFFTKLGFSHASLLAHLTAWVELIGGICLFLGLFARAAAIPLAIVMITALSTAHIKALQSIFVDPTTFNSQAPVTFLIVSLVILAFGPGLFSLDALFKRSLLGEQK